MQLAETRLRMAALIGTHEASGRVTHWLHRQAMEKEKARADGAMDREAIAKVDLTREVLRREAVEQELAKARQEITELLELLNNPSPRRGLRKRRAARVSQ